MGNTGLGKHKDVHSSDSTLEFETGKKMFPSEHEAKIILSAREPDFESQSDYEFEDDLMEPEPPQKRTVPTVFMWENGGREVLLSGSFNDWKTRIPMSQSQGEFSAIIELPEGEHEYKFCVDGRWIHDPNAPTTNDNFGGRNNVINVQKSDFEVFQALESDASASIGSAGSIKSMSGSPPGSYHQLIPSHHNPVIVHDGMHSSVPPVLPPHLLHVILNKEVVDHNDPSLLPEPDHVSLNHLYALSIKPINIVIACICSSNNPIKRGGILPTEQINVAEMQPSEGRD
ncbi:5'-AMP-activated protein kinase subunit beta-2-like [Montipora capricornis]|uniref:5'-AMP-activated protein kinase subunit beta-2-like n=1 Tax=Montipora capricornis TaxID=246305 RepID=UPI0035F17836